MKKGILLNSELSYLIAKLGHTDTIIIADAGLPIPAGVQRIDLALVRGVPTFEQVLEAILSEMVVEKVTVAYEIKDNNAQLLNLLEQKLSCDFLFCTHEEFKTHSKQAVAIIRTGEATAYANIMLHAGVQF
jgi:D-ribose pyranase